MVAMVCAKLITKQADNDQQHSYFFFNGGIFRPPFKFSLFL